MKFPPYTLTELIRQDDFINWVLNPTDELDRYWSLFQEEYPEKESTVESAREYVILLAEDTGRHIPEPAQTHKMWKAVEEVMQHDMPEKEAITSNPVDWKWLRIAASILLISGIGWFVYSNYNNHSNLKLFAGNVGESQLDGIVEKGNDTGKPKMVLLPDGSSVILQPGAKLIWPKTEKISKREVKLIGKAFFEIVKDESRPFYVYAYGVATKVLGTSFTVDANEQSQEVEVEVMTGKVSVFPISEKEMEEEILPESEQKGVVLYPDQKVALSLVGGNIIRPVEKIVIRKSTSEDLSQQLFIFDETPVSEVFKALEAAYNVTIRYDEKLLKHCPLTATLVGQPFNKKLEVICQAIDAEYILEDTLVVISGKGCN